MTVDDFAMNVALTEYVEASNNLRDKLLHEKTRLEMVHLSKRVFDVLGERLGVPMDRVENPASIVPEDISEARNSWIDMKREADLAHQGVENARAAYWLAVKKHQKTLGLRSRL